MISLKVFYDGTTEEVIFLIVIVVVVTISGKLFSKFKQNRNARGIEEYLKSLEQIQVDSDSVVVDGTSYSESVPVDAYDTELDPNDPSFYRGTGFSSDLSIRKRFHKQKNFTRFKSTIYVPLMYKGTKYEISTNLPIDQTTLRMRLYMQKKISVYIQESNDIDDTHSEIEFLLDFRFMNEKSITLVPTNYHKVE